MTDESPSFLYPDWPAPTRVRAAVSTRIGGCSHGAWAGFNLGSHCGDADSAVAANREILGRALRLPSAPAWLRQVHDRRVLHLPVAEGEQADAAWSGDCGPVCAILAADCLPVLFCDRGGAVVAAAHAGWRGLAAGVLEATVAALPVSPSRLMAWLGPAIGPRAFEVGDEVRCAFLDGDAAAATAFRPAARPRYWFADLFALARLRLRAAGVGLVLGGGLCTYSDPVRFYSYRRDGVTGRMAALIWLEPG